MKIRKADYADIPIIQQLAEQTWKISYQQMLVPEQIDYMLDKMYSYEALKNQIDNGKPFFIYQNESQIDIGFISFELQVQQLNCHIHKLYVLPEFQNQSIGKKLFRLAIDVARQHNIQSISLYVNRNNPAIHFYRKIGMQVASSHDFDIGNGFYMNDYKMQANINQLTINT